MPTTYVVTGASSGIGLELVKQLAARGDTVYATCRKKASSSTGVDLISGIDGDVKIIEGIDVARDDVKDALTAALAGVAVDVVVHNAGGIVGGTGPTSDRGDMKGLMGTQALDAVTSDAMLSAFQLNTVGPLRVQQALNANMASPGGKVCIISTGMASIGDNGSGGLYAYRASKAAVNMVSKSMAADLKGRGIAVVAVAPGFVATEFGQLGEEAMAKMGAMPVSKSCAGLIKVFDDLDLERTGRFMMVPTDGGEPHEHPVGW